MKYPYWTTGTLNTYAPEPFGYFDVAMRLHGFNSAYLRTDSPQCPIGGQFEVWENGKLICYGAIESEMQDLVDFLNEEV